MGKARIRYARLSDKLALKLVRDYIRFGDGKIRKVRNSERYYFEAPEGGTVSMRYVRRYARWILAEGL